MHNEKKSENRAMIIDIVILAAGKGTRMKSQRAKVLQTLAGKPLLAHVIDSARSVSNSHLHIVIGHDAQKVREAFADEEVNWIEQTEQLGTGHAVLQTLQQLADQGKTLVLYGDVPLISPGCLYQMLEKVNPNNMSLLTVELEKPQGYGRIIRNRENSIKAIVEEKDASDEQKRIRECNSGILAIDNACLRKLLPQISNHNKQKEYYLTDLIELACENGITVNGINAEHVYEVQGINDKKQLAELERIWQKKQAEKLLQQGVTLADPDRIDIRGSLSHGEDVSIDINCIFSGDVQLGDNVRIGANCIIGEVGKKVIIAENCEIKANTIIEEAIIEPGCVVGPFARLRPGTSLCSNVKIGNFVETKNAFIGSESKVNHLSYIGDAELGKDVNIGAGTITCNYDGVNKHKTRIDDNAFIGSNTSLVAPVNIGKSATIGAGSTINMNVNEKELAVARGKQKNIQGWNRPKKREE